MKFSSSIINPVNIKNFVFLILLFTINTNVYSQTDWVNFLIKKEKGYMSVSIDLDFNDAKPNFKNLLIVGTNYNNHYQNGFPNEKGQEKLYAYSDTVAININRLTKNRIVGIITYQGSTFDIFYVKDTIQIRENINKVLDNDFSNNTHYIYIKKDKNWNYYFNIIFPENANANFISNHQYLFELVSQGDNLSGLRKVNHWVSFKKEKKRLKFMNQIKGLDFKIDSVNFKKERKVPYELVISRKDSIKPKTISQLTQLLQLLIEKSNGFYEGWSTEIKKQD